MPVKRKARRFVHLLAEQLKSDSLRKKHDKDLRSAFHNAVADLPEGALKTELNDRLKVYFKKLKLYRKETKATSQVPLKGSKDADGHSNSTPGSQPTPRLVLPFNLYNKKGYKINPTTLDKIDKEKHQEIYKCLLSSEIRVMSEAKILALLATMRGRSVEEESELTSNIEWVDDMQMLANIMVSKQDEASVQKVMTIFSNKLSATVDILLTEKKPKRVHNLKKKMFQFIQLFHMKRKTLSEFTKPPRFEDLMAALISVYIDLEVADSRKLEEAEKISVGKKLASEVSLYFQHAPQYGVDVIAQLGTLTHKTIELLYPFLRRVLQDPVIQNTEDYTKYICTIRQVMQFLSDEDQIVMAGSQVPAPKKYLTWLRERDDSLLDEMPETKRFRGIHITSFLLREASSSLIEELLNVVTADMTDVDEESVSHPTEEEMRVDSSEKDNKSVVVDVQESEEAPLFFIDKTADTRTAKDMKGKYADLGGGNSQENDDDAESIEFGDADLDRMLAAMDESSADEEEPEASSDDENVSDSDTKRRKKYPTPRRALLKSKKQPLSNLAGIGNGTWVMPSDSKILSDNESLNDADSSRENANLTPSKSIMKSTDRALSDLVRGGEDSCSMLNDFVLTPEKVVSPLKDNKSPQSVKKSVIAQANEPASPEFLSSALDGSYSETGIDTATNDEDEDSGDDFDTTIIDIKQPPPALVMEMSPSDEPVRLVAIEKASEPPKIKSPGRSPKAKHRSPKPLIFGSAPQPKSPVIKSPKHCSSVGKSPIHAESPKIKSPKRSSAMSDLGSPKAALMISENESVRSPRTKTPKHSSTMGKLGSPKSPILPGSPRIKSPERSSAPRIKSPILCLSKCPEVKSSGSSKCSSSDPLSDSTASSEEMEVEESTSIVSRLRGNKKPSSQEKPEAKQDGTPSVKKRMSTAKPKDTPIKRTRRSSRQPASSAEDEISQDTTRREKGSFGEENGMAVDSSEVKSPKIKSPKLQSPRSKVLVSESSKYLSLETQSGSTRFVTAEEVEAEWSALIASPLKVGKNSQEEPKAKQDSTPSHKKRVSSVKPKGTPIKRTRRSSRQPASSTEDDIGTNDDGVGQQTPRSGKVSDNSEGSGMHTSEKIGSDESVDLQTTSSSSGIQTRRRRRTISDVSETSDLSQTVIDSEQTPFDSPSKVYGLRRRSMPASQGKVSSPAAKLKAIPEGSTKTRVDALRSEASSTPQSPKFSQSSPKRTPRTRKSLFQIDEHEEVDENKSSRKSPSPQKPATPATPTRNLRRRSEVGSVKK